MREIPLPNMAGADMLTIYAPNANLLNILGMVKGGKMKGLNIEVILKIRTNLKLNLISESN
jgi:hypothetical protein